MHGGRDRVVPAAHSEWLARHCLPAQLRLFPDGGHVSLLNSATDALERLRTHTG
jgi:pimeloyl-ACP methyl ester carboxylesterase